MDFKKIVISCFIIWLAQRTTNGLEISSDLPSFSNFLQSRNKRDDGYDVKCHQSGTGTVHYMLNYENYYKNGEYFMNMILQTSN